MTSNASSLRVRYFSGTGNSRRVALWIGERATELDIDVEVVSIDNDTDSESGALEGFVSPAHGFTATWYMIRRVIGLPYGHRADAFVVSTRAGMRFGPLFTPGLSGTATFVIALLLWLKGYRVRGVAMIDMPSNWIAFHSGLSPASARAIIERARPKTRRFADRILTGHWVWISPDIVYEAVMGLLLLPVSVGYLVLGRFWLAKQFFAGPSCHVCMQCERNCPAGAIVIRNGRPYWRYHCESCMRCMAFCPTRAIEVSHPWALLVAWAALVPISAFGLPFHWAAQLAYAYAILWTSYWVLSWMVRRPLMGRLLSVLTPTHFYRRYHEPDTRVVDLSVGMREHET